MKILHVILDDTVKKNLVYVMSLTNTISPFSENHLLTDRHVNIPNAEIIPLKYAHWNPLSIRNVFLKSLYTLMPDIVHIHGCWNYANYQCLKMASNRGFVTFFSPYGGITMKNIKENFWKEKVWKLLWYQRPMIKAASEIIIQKKKEENVLNMLGRNEGITLLQPNDDDEKEYGMQLLELYKKAHFERIKNEVSMQTLAALHNQLHDLLHSRPMAEVHLSKREQEQYNVFCEAQELKDVVTKPYQIPRYNDGDACGVIYKMIGQLKKDLNKGKATFNDIFQLTATMQNNDYDEDQLVSGLEKNGTLLFTRRLIEIADELCGIDIGFMPCLPLDDEETTNIKLKLFKARLS